MTRWTGRVVVPIEIAITFDHDGTEFDDDAAETAAIRRVEEYLETVVGDHQGIVVTASGALDGRGLDEFTPTATL